MYPCEQISRFGHPYHEKPGIFACKLPKSRRVDSPDDFSHACNTSRFYRTS
jgi:hypothetical protein